MTNERKLAGLWRCSTTARKGKMECMQLVSGVVLCS